MSQRCQENDTQRRRSTNEKTLRLQREAVERKLRDLWKTQALLSKGRTQPDASHCSLGRMRNHGYREKLDCTEAACKTICVKHGWLDRSSALNVRGCSFWQMAIRPAHNGLLWWSTPCLRDMQMTKQYGNQRTTTLTYFTNSLGSDKSYLQWKHR